MNYKHSKLKLANLNKQRIATEFLVFMEIIAKFRKIHFLRVTKIIAG